MPKFDAIRQRMTVPAMVNDPVMTPVAEDVPDMSSSYLSSVVQSMSDSLVVIGKGGRIAAVNQATLQLLGYEEVDLIGQTPDILFADGTARGNGLETLHERGIVQRGEKTLRTKDGREIPVFYSGSVLRDYNGQVAGVVCVAHDATKQKQLEQGLRDALSREQELGQLKSQFVSTVSHEFRTPLAIIQSNSEMLRLHHDQMPAGEQDACFDMIQQQIKHMTRLLEGALTIEKMQAGRIAFQPEPVNMDALCQEMVNALQGRVKRRITYVLQGENQDIMVDRGLIRQMMTHLLSNAVKFSSAGSQITIILSGMDEAMRLEIQDQGIGIPLPDQARLFEPFFRASNVGTIGGTGLGLALTRQVVDLHSGTITVSSQADAGTRMTVTLPYVPE